MSVAMQGGPLILALPSKGRLKEQAEAWLADCGLPVRSVGGDRGYAARIDGLEDVEVRLVSAAEIAGALFSGEAHLGVTGEDLLRELADDLDDRILLLQALGFGRADLVVAAPKGWIDVDTMADVDEVAHLFLARTGRRLRVATKYLTQTRAFFAQHGVIDYRIVESGGATEGAPAAGAAELVADITTTGATLAANGLKVLSDGLILASQAQLAASLRATWTAPQLRSARRLLRIVEARARGRRTATLIWPAEFEETARTAIETLAGVIAAPRPFGVLVGGRDVFAAAGALSDAGVGPVTVANPTYVFEAASEVIEELARRLQL
ncbi:ATP phosphoribosyltransferase [Phenylobacterium sp.]|jgi:ATP phosphoribosyltransferase|uniref:ATP phosphoribosyltransferase n=1 Tax=Phenylobacterium sp. TaxID=1871053 RepID=UPI002F41E1A1